jgi:hypothetical protein
VIKCTSAESVAESCWITANVRPGPPAATPKLGEKSHRRKVVFIATTLAGRPAVVSAFDVPVVAITEIPGMHANVTANAVHLVSGLISASRLRP